MYQHFNLLSDYDIQDSSELKICETISRIQIYCDPIEDIFLKSPL